MAGSAVVKVGGSLLDWDELPTRLPEYLLSLKKDIVVLIAGGGSAVDLIRDIDRRHSLGEERSHTLALHALDLSAHILASRVSGLDVVESAEAMRDTVYAGRTPILAVARFINADDHSAYEPLPHTWSVTSDSIAARIATLLGPKELVLLKSAPLPARTSRVEAARLGLVDPYFPVAAQRLKKVSYMNLREPDGAPRPLK